MQTNFCIKNIKSSVTTGLQSLELPCGASIGTIVRLYKKDAWRDEKAKHFKYRIIFNCKESERPQDNLIHGKVLHFNNLGDMGIKLKI